MQAQFSLLIYDILPQEQTYILYTFNRLSAGHTWPINHYWVVPVSNISCLKHKQNISLCLLLVIQWLQQPSWYSTVWHSSYKEV